MGFHLVAALVLGFIVDQDLVNLAADVDLAARRATLRPAVDGADQQREDHPLHGGEEIQVLRRSPTFPGLFLGTDSQRKKLISVKKKVSVRSKSVPRKVCRRVGEMRLLL